MVGWGWRGGGLYGSPFALLSSTVHGFFRPSILSPQSRSTSQSERGTRRSDERIGRTTFNADLYVYIDVYMYTYRI